MLGLVGKNVESVKFIGKRDINMDANLKNIFEKYDGAYKVYPYFNDAKELFRIFLWAVFRETSFNKQK